MTERYPYPRVSHARLLLDALENDILKKKKNNFPRSRSNELHRYVNIKARFTSVTRDRSRHYSMYLTLPGIRTNRRVTRKIFAKSTNKILERKWKFFRYKVLRRESFGVPISPSKPYFVKILIFLFFGSPFCKF